MISSSPPEVFSGKGVLKMCSKLTGEHQFQNVLPLSALLTVYKSFIRPHLDYGNIIYDKAFNESFHEKLNPFNITLL